MSLTYRTVCDICGKVVEGWPEGGHQHQLGWMTINSDSDYNFVRRDICEECVPHVERALESVKRFFSAERQP